MYEPFYSISIITIVRSATKCNIKLKMMLCIHYFLVRRKKLFRQPRTDLSEIIDKNDIPLPSHFLILCSVNVATRTNSWKWK